MSKSSPPPPPLPVWTPHLFSPLPRKKTKVTLAPPCSLLIERAQGLSGASRACVRNRICVDDDAPIAFLAQVKILLGPLQCFQRKVHTFLTVPGSRPARDLGLHSLLASRWRDAWRRGLISCLRDARSGRILETIPRGAEWPPSPPARPLPPPPLLAPPASRNSPVSAGAAGGRAESDRTSSRKWGEESRCAWGPGKGWAACVWGDHEGLGRWAAETGCRTHI